MKKNILLWVAVVLATASCGESLDDINRNPNATEIPNPAYLLTGVEKNGADLYWGTSLGFGGTLLFVQHWAAIQYTDIDRYNFTNSDGIVTSPWNTGYATLITNLDGILALDDATANANYKGAALALRSWVFLLLTDLYGDAPYSEVGKTLVPKYDAQKDIYDGLFADLTEALRLLNPGAGAISGDVVYAGDIAKWRKFANSLKLRIALQIADQEPEKAKQTVAGLLPAENLIASNAETFQVVYSASPYNNPQHAHYVSRDDYRISKTIVDKLKALNDPRLPVYADLPTDETVAGYAGGANGLTNGDANNQGFAKLSRAGAYFIRDVAPAVFYNYAEVLFNLAEAAQRGYIGGDAKDYYEQAIKASFNQFGITDAAAIDAYLAQNDVKYNAANWQKSIGEQKWIALFGQGPDAFTEWRRLDYPQLVAGPASVLNGKIPARLFYPGTEQSLNKKNREEATGRQGEDLLTTKLWFDKY
ncbi:MAG: SusD/RagB family nutrient-binding outer membrane lipoprotein [Bacteroidales bacterium]